MLDEKRIAAIGLRCLLITAGPWEVFGRSRHIIGNTLDSADALRTGHHQWTHNTTDANAEFIANARQDIPDLLDEVIHLRAALTEIKNLSFGHTGHDYQQIEELAREALGDE